MWPAEVASVAGAFAPSPRLFKSSASKAAAASSSGVRPPTQRMEWSSRPPGGWEVGSVESGRLALVLSGLGGFERGETMSGLIVFFLMVFGKPAPRREISEIFQHLLDRVGGALRSLGIEQAASRVALGKLETPQNDLLETGFEVFLLEIELGLMS